MLLTLIKDDASKFAEVISKILDVDVLIVDSDNRTVSNTNRYFDKFTLIRRSSVIGQVISTKKVIAIDDRKQFASCKECPDFYECEMTGLIGVPIFYNEAVVGAIALVIPKQRVVQIFKDVRNSVEFLERMADLLSIKIQNKDDYNTLNFIRREREVLMDSMEDAIVSTDDMGYITYYNKNFVAYFNLEGSYVGRMIHEVIPNKIISDFLDKQEEVKNRVIFTEAEQGNFYGFVSCNNININGTRNGMLFTFKPLVKLNTVINELGINNTRVSFQWAEQRLFPQSLMGEAKRLAVTDKMVLITGEEGSGQEALAKCIYKFSDRNQSSMVQVKCNRVYHELQEGAVFGELGQLHLANDGTIYFQDVDQLSLRMQKMLVEFLKTSTLRHSNGRDVKIDVRMIFSSSQDLEKLSQQGLFLDELYYRISENLLRIPPVRTDHAMLRRMIDSSIQFYKENHGKPDLYFEDEVIRRFYRYNWPKNLEQVEETIDALVNQCSQNVTLRDLEALNLLEDDEERVQSISEIERDRIARLLQTNRNKDDVARLLGISRATLYRKIKTYQL